MYYLHVTSVTSSEVLLSYQTGKQGDYFGFFFFGTSVVGFFLVGWVGFFLIPDPCL